MEIDAGHRSPQGHDPLHRRNSIGFFIMGLLNNLFYCVVISAAQSLCLTFGYGHLVPLVVYMNICLGLLMLVLNSLVGHYLSYTTRVVLTAAGQFLGLSGIVLSLLLTNIPDPSRFGILLFSVCCVGSACSFGETVVLGYFARFPPHFVGYWASGTGSSGVVAALLYGTLQLAGWSNAMTFGLQLGISTLYLVAFFGCIREYPDCPAILPPSDSGRHGDDTDEPFLGPHPVTWARIQTVTRQVWWIALQLLLVYMFEYACQNAAAYIQPPSEVLRQDCPLCRHFYVACQLTYQLGVLLSRSSLRYIQIARVDIISALQGINMMGWLLAAKYLWFGTPPWLYMMLPWMFYVGLLGGASYVNVYYLILTHPKVHSGDRTLAMNLGTFYTNIGLNAGTLLVLLLSLTVFGDRQGH